MNIKMLFDKKAYKSNKEEINYIIYKLNNYFLLYYYYIIIKFNNK